MGYKKVSPAGNRVSRWSLQRVLLFTLSFIVLFGMIIQVTTAQEIIRNDFEDGTTQSWYPRGDGVAIEAATEAANSGSLSLKVTGRTSNWHGASLNLSPIMQTGAVYQLTCYVRMVDGQSASTINMTIQKTPVGGNTGWDQVASASVDTGWVMLQNHYTLAAEVTAIEVYIESSLETAEYYIDDFSLSLITPAPENPDGPLVENGFEDGNDGWSPRGSGVVIQPVTEAAHSGSASLKVTGRTSGWHGASLDLAARLLQGAVYELTAHVKLVEGQTATNVNMTIQRTDAGNNTYYEWVASAAADTAWVMLRGSYSFTGAVNGLLVYIEAQSATAEYYIDDVTIIMTTPPPLDQSGIITDFEDGSTQGWNSRIGEETVEITSADTQSGLYALQITGRKQFYSGPSINVLGKMHTGSKYYISVWVKLLPGEAATNLRVSIQRSLSGTTNYSTVVPNTLVTEHAWVQLTTRYTFGYEVDALSLYIESDSGLASFYIDDFELRYLDPLPVQTEIPSLKEVLSDYFPIGAAIEPSETITIHNELLKKHFASVTAGNVMKPSTLQKSEGEFSFTEADNIVNFARENNMLVRGHTLVWHNQTPDWFFRDSEGNALQATPENKELMIRRLESHITTVVDHFKDDVFAWDVVNEAIDVSQPDGLRRSKWYELIGPEYIDLAFQFARAADPDALLYINDYNTVVEAQKRNVFYELVSSMLARGIPLDGVGHQLHINIEAPTADMIGQTIELFAGLGLDNQITEMDMSIYNNSTDSYTQVSEEIMITQGYRYKEIFEELKRLKDYISSVTLWGIADDNTWLKYFPITRLDLPLLFDEELQAKYAYWGIVDPARLPVLMYRQEIPQSQAKVDCKSGLFWDIMPWIPIRPAGQRSASFKAMWDTKQLFILADVIDPEKNDKGDLVEIFLDLNNGKTESHEDDDMALSFTRGRTKHNKLNWKTTNFDWGYRFEVALPLDAEMVLGQEIGFDIRFTDAENPAEILSWNDITHSQDNDTSRYGTLILAKRIGITTANPVRGRDIVVDGYIERSWNSAKCIETATWVQGDNGATAKVRTLWAPLTRTLYVLAEVTDNLLSDASTNPWEQDSIEVFIDRNNGKTGYFEADDAQYRISFNNVQSFGGSANADAIVSATSLTNDGYLVELSLTFSDMDPESVRFIGFDIQVNDDGSGSGVRSSIVTWNDPEGTAYRNTENYGVLLFTHAASRCIPRFGIRRHTNRFHHFR